MDEKPECVLRLTLTDKLASTFLLYWVGIARQRRNIAAILILCPMDENSVSVPGSPFIISILFHDEIYYFKRFRKLNFLESLPIS